MGLKMSEAAPLLQLVKDKGGRARGRAPGYGEGLGKHEEQEARADGCAHDHHPQGTRPFKG